MNYVLMVNALSLLMLSGALSVPLHNGRGPGRGIEMSLTIAGDREGSLWIGVIH